MANKDKLYNKRYKTLKEHRAAVKARKLLEGGKNKGPVANADAYGSTIKKPAPKKPSKAPTSSSKPPSKPSTPKPKQTTKQEASSRFYSSSSQGTIAKAERGKARFFAGGKGGEYDKPTYKGGARAKVKKRSASKPKVTGKNRFERRKGR